MKKLIFPILVLGSFLCHAQLKIPLSYSNLNIDHSGGLRFENQISKINAFVQAPEFTLSNLIGNPTGSARGIDF
nr:hypothetical protein [Bacteroidota bacterium]